MRFTQEEFDTMVEQLLGGRLDSYDMLCTIADRVLRPSVIRWCNTDDTLRGRGLEEDIMQEIHTKLLLNVVTRFLRRNGPEGELNRDPEGFQAWMFTVARNVKRDFANKLRARDIKTRELEGTEAETLSSEELAGQQTHVDRLRQSFDVVLSADAGVHKVLTWLAQSLYILELDVSKIQSTQIVLEAFSEKSLYEMYESVRDAADRIPWMYISREQNRRIAAALDAPYDAGRTWGQVTYKSLFMMYHGEPSGKKSVSDWVNRINSIIKRKLGKMNSESAEDVCNGKRGVGDEPFTG